MRIRPPMQGTRVQALVQEDPTCRGATKPAPLAATRESPHAAAKTQHSQKERKKEITQKKDLF